MKNILITGADGFIGSHLVEHMVKKGYNVKAFVYYNSFNSWGWLDTIEPDILKQIEIFTGDIRDPYCVKKALTNCTAVLHLAALIAIPYSYYAPESYLDTNIRGTLNVLQASQELNIERVLITSTSEVYGTAQYVPIDENHPRQGQSPYSASKIAADALAESFYRSFNLPVTIVRPFNTYGPRQSARAVIPTIISQLLNNCSKIQLGALYPTRDLVYVKDTVAGFEEILQNNNLIGQEINIATQQEISVKDLAQLLINLTGKDAAITSTDERLRPENSEVYRLLGSNRKLTEQTNWKPLYSLEQGLSETIEWFKNKDNLNKYKAHIYNV